mgnify:CR=1 FL=1
MKAHEAPTEVERLCRRHLARCAVELEKNCCPRVYLEIVRRHFGHLRDDLLGDIFQNGRSMESDNEKVL